MELPNAYRFNYIDLEESLTKIQMVENVNRGVDWLNINFPNWFNDVDLSTLCLSDADSCICGQLFFDLEMKKIFIDEDEIEAQEDYYSNIDGFQIVHDIFGPKWTVAHGFRSSNVLTTGSKEYDFLGTLWVEQIEKHRAEAGTMLGVVD